MEKLNEKDSEGFDLRKEQSELERLFGFEAALKVRDEFDFLHYAETDPSYNVQHHEVSETEKTEVQRGVPPVGFDKVSFEVEPALNEDQLAQLDELDEIREQSGERDMDRDMDNERDF